MAKPGPKVRAMRPQLAGEQGWRCCWCGCRMRLEVGHPDSATIEHIVPITKGGGNRWANLAAACLACNQRRGAISVGKMLQLGGDPQWGAKQRRRHAEGALAEAMRRAVNQERAA